MHPLRPLKPIGLALAAVASAAAVALASADDHVALAATLEFPPDVSARRPAPSAQPQRDRGTWLARQIQDRETGRDSRAEIRLTLYDRHGRARERRLTLLSKRGQGKTGDRVLTRFTYPEDIRGTGFLVWEHPDEDDERFLYLPSLGRVRRIAGAEAQESFVGTDFTYEDIGGREFDDYAYVMLDENAVWTPRGGAAQPAYRLESTRRDRGARYPRVVSTVTRDFVVVAADVFNRRDEREKVYAVGRLERVEGIWTVLAAEMSNLLDRTKTTLEVEAMDYDVGLTDARFSRRELEAGAK